MSVLKTGDRVTRIPFVNEEEEIWSEAARIPPGATGTILKYTEEYVYVEWDKRYHYDQYQDYGSKNGLCWGVEKNAIEKIEDTPERKQQLILDKIKYLYERNPLDKSRAVPTESIRREQGTTPEVRTPYSGTGVGIQRVNRALSGTLDSSELRRVQRYLDQFRFDEFTYTVQEQSRAINADRQLRASTRTNAAVNQSTVYEELSERDRIRSLERSREQREQAEANRTVPSLTGRLINRINF